MSKVICNRNDECKNETCPHFEEHDLCFDCVGTQCEIMGAEIKCIPEDELDRLRHPERKPIRFELAEGEG